MFTPRDPDEYLLPSERRVVRVRRHWACLAWDVFEAAALLAVAIMVSYLLPQAWWLAQNILWYAALFVVLRFAYTVLEWWVERIVVTDKRFVMTTGVFTIKVPMLPVSKITDLTFKQTMMGRIFGYGTMILETAGQIQALNHIEYLPNAQQVYDAVSELLFGDKDSQQKRFSMIQAQRLASGKKLVG